VPEEENLIRCNFYEKIPKKILSNKLYERHGKDLA
jgi:hypothetical protein